MTQFERRVIALARELIKRLGVRPFERLLPRIDAFRRS